MTSLSYMFLWKFLGSPLTPLFSAVGLSYMFLPLAYVFLRNPYIGISEEHIRQGEEHIRHAHSRKQRGKGGP